MWESEKFARFSMPARLLSIALIDVSDDQGRFRAHPAWLRSNVFPYDDFTLSDLEGWLQDVAANETVLLYEVDGQRYGQLINWWKYQKPQYATPSLMPAPAGWQDRIRHKVGKQILTHNWTDTNGNTCPDTCDASGLPRVGTPVATPIKTPVATPVLIPVPTPVATPDATRDGDDYDYEDGEGDERDRPSGVSSSPLVIDLDAVGVGTQVPKAVLRAYESHVGLIHSPLLSEKMVKAVADYGEPWVVDAIGVAVTANKRSWSYIAGILHNWRTEGRNGAAKPVKPNGHSPPANENDPATPGTAAYFAAAAAELGISLDEAKLRYQQGFQ